MPDARHAAAGPPRTLTTWFPHARRRLRRYPRFNRLRMAEWRGISARACGDSRLQLARPHPWRLWQQAPVAPREDIESDGQGPASRGAANDHRAPAASAHRTHFRPFKIVPFFVPTL